MVSETTDRDKTADDDMEEEDDDDDEIKDIRQVRWKGGDACPELQVRWRVDPTLQWASFENVMKDAKQKVLDFAQSGKRGAEYINTYFAQQKAGGGTRPLVACEPTALTSSSKAVLAVPVAKADIPVATTTKIVLCNHDVYRAMITYNAEMNASYYKEGEELYNTKCSLCNISLVDQVSPGSLSNEIKPTANQPAYVCIQRLTQRCLHSVCYTCFSQEAAKGSPLGTRRCSSRTTG